MNLMKQMKQMKQYKLLNPGPACTTQKVKDAMLEIGDVCPREEEIGDLMLNVSLNIKRLLTSKPENFECALLTSSGTGSVEMVISSLPKDSNVLNIINGAYGTRIRSMLDVYDIDHVNLDFEEGYIDLDIVIKLLHNNNFTHVCFVHCETTTGRINNLKNLCLIAKFYGCDTIVDAMSSAFAYPIDLFEDKVDFICCSSNKNIQGMAGLGIVVFRKDLLKDLHARTVYLDLKSQTEYFQKSHQMRFTPPVQIINALSVALDELKEETVERRYDRYKNLSNYILYAMQEQGFKPLVEENEQSVIITSFLEPSNFNFEKFHLYLKERGFVIYPGKVSNQNTFRIANIGELSVDDIEIFISHVQNYNKINKIFIFQPFVYLDNVINYFKRKLEI